MFYFQFVTIDGERLEGRGNMDDLRRSLRAFGIKKPENARLCHRSFIQWKVGYFYYAVSPKMHFYVIVNDGDGFREDLSPS
jgi:hypothetical protein